MALATPPFEIKPLGRQLYLCDGFHVDLRAFDWNGSCTCPTFAGCCRFVLERQVIARDQGKRWRCDHVLATRAWVMETIFPAIVEEQEKIIELPVANETRAADFSL